LREIIDAFAYCWSCVGVSGGGAWNWPPPVCIARRASVCTLYCSSAACVSKFTAASRGRPAIVQCHPRSFTVFWYKSKARMGLPISPS